MCALLHAPRFLPFKLKGASIKSSRKVAMNSKPSGVGAGIRRLLVVICTAVLIPGDTLAAPLSLQTTQTSATQAQSAQIPADQLDSLVAPIALYPDPMLAQVLAASTYPLEIIQLQQWLTKNPGLKDKALVAAVEKQPWDPSVQAMAALPDVVKRLADDIQWTTDLGNAFLAQQSGVMDAVQRMRQKAQGTGNLKSTEQQKVETKTVENKTVIVVEQANPQVVYVPSYNPTVVYGPPVYPYPPIYYPPPGAYVAGMAISFGVGLAMGAAWGGGWGWGCGWGGNNDITINRNNNFNRNTNINGGNRNNINGGNRPSQQPGRGGNNWQHNPQHRGGAPYGDRGTADRFGGQARGDSLANRQAGAKNQISQQGGNLASNNRSGVGDRGGVGGNRGGVGDRGGVGSNNGGGNRGGVGAGDRGGAGVSNREGAGVSNRSAGGANSIGGRNVSGSSGSRGGFGGGGGGYNGASARQSSSRGASSMGSRGGGGSRSGGGRRR
jgi:hypothetical protein